MLVTPGSRYLQPTTGKLRDSAGFARWLAQNSQNLARVIQAVFWLEWVGCGPRSSARVIRRAKRRRDLPDEGRLMREVEGPRRSVGRCSSKLSGCESQAKLIDLSCFRTTNRMYLEPHKSVILSEAPRGSAGSQTAYARSRRTPAMPVGRCSSKLSGHALQANQKSHKL